MTFDSYCDKNLNLLPSFHLEKSNASTVRQELEYNRKCWRYCLSDLFAQQPQHNICLAFTLGHLLLKAF